MLSISILSHSHHSISRDTKCKPWTPELFAQQDMDMCASEDKLFLEHVGQTKHQWEQCSLIATTGLKNLNLE